MDAIAFLALVRRRWLPVLACLVAGLTGAVALTRSTEKEYRATSTLFINLPAARGVQEALQGVDLSFQLMKSYARIATSRSAVAEVIDRLDLLRPPNLSAEPEEETLLIRVSARDHNPELAQRVANAGAAVLVDTIDDLERNKEGAIEARLIDAATRPSTPVNPRPGVNLTVGGILGLVVGLSAAGLIEALDRTVKDPAAAGAIIGAPLLGTVPKRRDADRLVTAEIPEDIASEAYRALRTAIRFVSVDQPIRSLLVTSAGAREGKTVTASNLAVAMAQGGDRVILVDADLRRARVRDLFHEEATLGLTSVLMRHCSAEDALVQEAAGLFLLPSGPLPPNPAEVASSQAMAQLVDDLHLLADFVIIDTTPILPVTDAVALSTQVDGVVFVVRSGRTRSDAAAEARRKLDVVGANVVGYVLNGVPRAEGVYPYGYRYAREVSRPPDLPVEAPVAST